MRATALVPSAASEVLVCVDERHNGEMAGTIYNPYLPKPAKFRSAYGVIIIMEKIFDTISFPQSYYEYRSFRPKRRGLKRERRETEERRYMPEELLIKEQQGKKATFIVQVQFRQNATWQGTITWTDEKKVQRFRSTLEMLKLMGDALGDSDEENIEWE